jgi:hypothetical protein
LHLPLETDVVLKLESDDFIYIMSNPELGLKQIAVPELTHTLKFHTARIGPFELLADPLCGWRPLHDVDSLENDLGYAVSWTQGYIALAERPGPSLFLPIMRR